MSGTLVVVEDDAALRDYLAQALRGDRWIVEATGDSAAVPAVVAACEPDVVLVDLHLEGQSGLELCAALVAERPDVPVVVMTGSTSEKDRMTSQRLSVEGYLTKPVNLQDFLDLVRELKRYWHEDMILPGVN